MIFDIELLISRKNELERNQGIIQQAWENANSLWNIESQDINQVFGIRKQDRVIQIEKNKLDYLEKLLTNATDERTLELVRGLRRHPLWRICGKYSRLVALWSQRQSKNIQLKYVGNQSQVSYEELYLIEPALIHILRNCVDHGIESAEQRASLAKPEEGSIYFSTERTHETLKFVVEDDGRGIDTETLAKKALEMKIWTLELVETATESEKMNLLFEPYLSTSRQVTTLSGMGVGMSAVRDLITKLGGEIQVQSEHGKGTRFLIHVPTKKVGKQLRK